MFVNGGNTDSIEHEEVLLLEEGSLPLTNNSTGEGTITKKIVLSLPDGTGSYEFVFSIGTAS